MIPKEFDPTKKMNPSSTYVLIGKRKKSKTEIIRQYMKIGKEIKINHTNTATTEYITE